MVLVGDTEYATGKGPTKSVAKEDAAKQTLEQLGLSA